MRGITTCANDSRRPLPVTGSPIRRAFRLSCMYPRSTPSSISMLRWVGLPSSSIEREPRRPGMVPSSTTVTPRAATFFPIFPAKAEEPLRLKSPSRPWPIASCRRMPGQPGPSTTVMVPAGAGRDSRLTSAWSTARVARAAELFQALEQLHFLRVFERDERIDRLIELQAGAFSHLHGMFPAARARNCPRRLCRILQRRQADLVGVSERCLLPRDRAHAHDLVDAEAPGLDDSFLEAPALAARVLEIEVGVIEPVRKQRPENARELAGFEVVRGEQEGLRGGKKLLGGVHERDMRVAEPVF